MAFNDILNVKIHHIGICRVNLKRWGYVRKEVYKQISNRMLIPKFMGKELTVLININSVRQ